MISLNPYNLMQQYIKLIYKRLLLKSRRLRMLRGLPHSKELG
jgi:hypothetical protein